MKASERNISLKLLAFVAVLLCFGLAIVFKLVSYQFVETGELERTARFTPVKTQDIKARRGRVFTQDGALLAVSVSNYNMSFDPQVAKEALFNRHKYALADSLSRISNSTKGQWLAKIERARKNGDQHIAIAQNVSHAEFKRVQNFPLFNLERLVGGFIWKRETHRVYPFGQMARRLIGRYEVREKEEYMVGMEGAFHHDILAGKDGSKRVHNLKTNITKTVEVITNATDGLDLISTVNSNIQDATHQALVEALEKHQAERGVAIVMEVKTGAIRAMSNLNLQEDGSYKEDFNYAINSRYEPGSTFKLISLLAALEDKVADTSKIFHAPYGKYTVYGKHVKDSKLGGYGPISLAKAFAVSSNTAFAEMIHQGYKSRPEQFVNRLYSMQMNQKLGIDIQGETQPIIRYPGDAGWSGLSLPWMSFGYEVQLTPLQMLSYYNAVANDGELVRPLFAEAVQKAGKVVKRFDKVVIHPSIASKKSIQIAQQLLRDVVEKTYGTASKLKESQLTFAGKTGTSQINYSVEDELNYVSSFAGYFPAQNPKYSCIVVIDKPDKSRQIYGADVAGPVFKSIAQNVLTETPYISEISIAQIEDVLGPTNTDQLELPNFLGMQKDDVRAILKNLDVEFQIKGEGIVTQQSEKAGTPITQIDNLELILS